MGSPKITPPSSQSSSPQSVLFLAPAESRRVPVFLPQRPLQSRPNNCLYTQELPLPEYLFLGTQSELDTNRDTTLATENNQVGKSIKINDYNY